jgi:hypothetical protein
MWIADDLDVGIEKGRGNRYLLRYGTNFSSFYALFYRGGEMI